MKERKTYPTLNEANSGCLTAAEPAMIMAVATEQAVPESIPYARIENGVLQVTPDIEEEMAAADCGEVVTMGEFQTMFAKWL